MIKLAKSDFVYNKNGVCDVLKWNECYIDHNFPPQQIKKKFIKFVMWIALLRMYDHVILGQRTRILFIYFLEELGLFLFLILIFYDTILSHF